MRRARATPGRGVLLVGMAQPAAPAAARSLTRAGMRVIGVRQPGRLAGRTRYCARSYVLPHELGADQLITAVEEICAADDIDVVVPLSDETLAILITRRPPGASWSVVGPRADVFKMLCDKSVLAQTTERVGLAVAGQVRVGPGAELAETPPLPAYVKVVAAVDDPRPAGRPIRVTTARDCEEAVRRIVDSGRDVIVQEEVLGERWRVHFARQGETLIHLGARTIADYPPRTGQSSVSSFEPAPPIAVAAARALLEKTGHEGIGSIQLILRDGLVYPHDVNLRLPASVGGTVTSGLDMPRLGVEIARGERIDSRPVSARRVRLAQLNGEWPALLDAFEGRAQPRSRGSIAKEILLAAVLPRRKLDPFDLTDPIPTLAALTAARHRLKPGAPG